MRPTLRLRDAAWCLAVAVVLLLVLEGPSIERSGERMEPGAERTVVLAIGRPAGWVADRLPFAGASDRVVGVLAADDPAGDPAERFDAAARSGDPVPPVTPESFRPDEVGERPPPRRPLRTMLVTGDSMILPLDAELARRTVDAGVRTVRDARVGTGISKSELADWGAIAAGQVRAERPDAVVVWLGANEGFPMPGPGGEDLECCGAAWAAEYATRARQMMETYRQDGTARVYWLTLPAPRDAGQARVARAVNAAVTVAAQAYRAHVRIVDTAGLFTPGWRYRDALAVAGRERIVRESDGIHVNALGARLAADVAQDAIARDFTVPR